MTTHEEINRSRDDIWLVHGGTATDGTIYGPPNKATPWGSAGCPLLPRSYRTMFGNQEVPASLKKFVGTSTVFIADLGANFLCQFGLSKLSPEGVSVIQSLISRLHIPPDQIAIPLGVSTRWMMKLPIRERTRKALGQIIELRREDGLLKKPILFGELFDEFLRIRSVGRTSLIDLLCVIESAELEQTTNDQSSETDSIEAITTNGLQQTTNDRSPQTDSIEPITTETFAGSWSAERLAPWGSPPTPLLPRWYRENLPHLQLPREIRKANPALKTVGEIGAFWKGVQPPVDKDWLHSLVGLARGHRPPPNYVVIPAGIDLSELARYPLRPRTAKVLREEDLLKGNNGLSVRELMSFRNFGIVSLLDLMCVAELALADRVSNDDTNTEGPVERTSEWDGMVDLLDRLLSAANEFYGATTVGEALRLDLSRLVSTIGITPALDSFAIRDLTEGSRITDTVIEQLAVFLASTTKRDQLILEHRLCTATPQVFEELGQLVGVSRERVRQIEKRLREAIEMRVGTEIDIIATLLGEQVQPVVDAVELDSLISNAFTGSEEKQSVDIAVWMVKSRLNYSCVNGICLNETALEIVRTLQKVANKIADDVGLLDEKTLRAQLPSDEWNDFFPQLIERCGFHRIGCRLAQKDTVGARAKAALLEIGRLATTEEIASISGIDSNRVVSQLSRLPTVARADKTRWGLAEWIDDVYEGVTAEIIQRINEDGGATSIERLVEEIPRLFGVSETSVRISVGTPQFVLQDGYVSMADESSITLRNLHDVIDGQTANGDPYWTFLVESRYFEGHSLARFPPELARELGCEPNGNIQALVAHPRDCGELSVIWRLASPTGASLGYLAEPLQQLGVSSGDRVRVVIKGPGVVELRREYPVTVSEGSSDTSAETLLERLKNRRRVI